MRAIVSRIPDDAMLNDHPQAEIEQLSNGMVEYPVAHK
jgi:hypothetical protein